MSKTKILLIFLIGLSLPLYIIWDIIAVDFEYSSLGEPQSGIKVDFKKIDNQELIFFPEKENYLFNQVELEIIFKEKIISSLEIIAYKNFLATFYPINNKVLTENDLRELLFSNIDIDLPIGSLFTQDDTVGILTPNNSYQTFFSAELFEKMGYKWEDLNNKEVGFASALEEDRLINFNEPHPSGTIFENKNKKYLIWEKEIFLISEDLEIENIIKTRPIKIENFPPEDFGKCLIKIDNEDEIVCSFEKKFSNQKSDYIFKFDGIKESDVEKIILKLSATSSKWSFKNNFLVSIENIKLKLIKKYRGYIPFI